LKLYIYVVQNVFRDLKKFYLFSETWESDSLAFGRIMVSVFRNIAEIDSKYVFSEKRMNPVLLL